MIARDTGWTVKVGYVDQATDAHGWMQVEALGLGLQRLWIQNRPINGVDGQEGETPLSSSPCDRG
jgi:hypothetical protein